MSLVAEDTRTAVEPWRDDAVSTPEGNGVYLGLTQTDLGITYRVELAHGGGTRYYRLDEITVLPRNRAPKANLTDGVEDDSASLTVGTVSGYVSQAYAGTGNKQYMFGPTTIIRSAETAAREEAWMREHSTPATRKAHEKRVKAAQGAATTLGKIRALTERQKAYYESEAEASTSDYWIERTRQWREDKI